MLPDSNFVGDSQIEMRDGEVGNFQGFQAYIFDEKQEICKLPKNNHFSNNGTEFLLQKLLF